METDINKTEQDSHTSCLENKQPPEERCVVVMKNDTTHKGPTNDSWISSKESDICGRYMIMNRYDGKADRMIMATDLLSSDQFKYKLTNETSSEVHNGNES